jgi:O-acetyl-ADP-ribose deacetylase (regulator of RNase III)/ADP-ribosylglycohydrolase
MKLIRGDITKLDVDAIVNAANHRLLGGGGVDGAIHRAAGPGLLEECRALGGCPTGEARVTAGHALPAKHVIHTVGPVWEGGEQGEGALLASAYRSSLRLALRRGLRTVAFPNISTGVYGFPTDLACRIAVDVVAEFERREPSLEVLFVCFSEENHRLYQERLAKGREVRGSYIACMLAGAAGDALGAPIEFDSLEEIRARFGPSGVRGYLELGEGRGKFTDDTQMTLFTAEGLLRARAPVISSVTRLRGSTERQLLWDSYQRWLFTQGVLPAKIDPEELVNGILVTEPGLCERRAPGQTCLSALAGGEPGSTACPLNYSKGCGGLMRVAPVGLVYPGEPEEAFDLGCEVAALTHGHPSGFLATGHLAALIALLVAGEPLRVAIEAATRLLCARPEHEECLASILAGCELADRALAEERAPSPVELEALGGGWVAEEALAISLCCALSHASDLPSGVLAAVNHTGDSDSTGSITGQILGVVLGEEAIPAPWSEGLELEELVRGVGADLWAGSRPLSRSPDPGWWRRYPPE